VSIRGLSLLQEGTYQISRRAFQPSIGDGIDPQYDLLVTFRLHQRFQEHVHSGGETGPLRAQQRLEAVHMGV
jgi:hypothetical protein